MHRHAAPRRSLVLTLCAAGPLAFGAGCDPQADPGYGGERLARLQGTVSSEAAPTTEADVGLLWMRPTADPACEGPVLGCAAGGGGSDDVCIQACAFDYASCDVEAGEAYVACVEACGGTASFEVLWGLCEGAGVGERVAVDGVFPARFTLDLLGPPPDEAVRADADGLRAAVAYIVAVDRSVRDIEVDLGTQAGVSAIVGGAPGHLLVYAAQELPATSEWGRYLGGETFAPGYHLVTSTPREPQCDDAGGCSGNDGHVRAPAPAGLDTEIEIELAPFADVAWPEL
jgi:hypothetical protein